MYPDWGMTTSFQMLHIGADKSLALPISLQHNQKNFSWMG
jgi:hypothetical protein